MMRNQALSENSMSPDSSLIDAADLEKRLDELRSLMRKEDPRDAIYACDKFNRDFPGSGQGWYVASILALRINEPAASLRAIELALQVEADHTLWLLQKANCLGLLGRGTEVRALASQMAGLIYPTAGLSASVGLLLARLDMHREAEILFAEALKLEPEIASHHYNLATVQRFLGRLDEAEASLDRAIELDPMDTEAWALRSGLRRQTGENNHIEGLQALLQQVDNKPRKQATVCHAIAKEMEDLGRYPESFEFLKKGADARRKNMRYDVNREIETMQKIQEVFNKSFFEEDVEGFANAAPIFIIGMPRTGTTLVERILGSHSAVHSAGELNNFAIDLVNVVNSLAGESEMVRSDLVAMSGKIDFETLGEAYIDSTRSVAGEQAHFIDKLPLNFLYGGLIHLALPKAKIIHVVRHPLDTCYAVFKTLFASAYPFSYDLKELGKYFVAYFELMQHWNSVMPGVMHTVQYEDLVANTRTITESMLDYCDLSWEEQCLNFHESAEHTTTASAAQIRKPVYQDSVGRWKHYENELQPVADILTEAGIAT